MNAGARLSVDHGALVDLCQRHGIRKLALFGSALGVELGPESDVDLLVEFLPGRIPGFLGLAALEAEFSAVFDGREVELRTYEDLSPRFRDRVRNEARNLYAAA